MMRVLAQPFNSPSREELIFEFYKTVNVIDSFEPTSSTIHGDQAIRIETGLSDPTATEKTVFVNEQLIYTTTESVFETESLGLTPGDTVTIRVQDTTSMVRDEGMREVLMTETLSWVVKTGCQPGFVEDCDGTET